MIDTASVYIIEALFIATVVIVALLAALITAGLERQRRELGLIRRELEAWAEEDLEIKRVKLRPQVRIAEPKEWLNTCAARAIGEEPGIVRFPVEHAYGEPRVLVGEDASGRRYFLSACTPDAIRRLPFASRWPWRSRLNRFGRSLHPLVPLSRGIESYELSTLNCGIVFDLEAAQVWKQLTGEELRRKQLWLYALPRSKKG